MKDPLFKRQSPCKDCPYRKDAPIAKWDIEHFKDVLRFDKDYIGTVWKCHQDDGCVCVGWLMDQHNRGLPSIKLRLLLSQHHITREYMDGLTCKSEMFPSIEAMCHHNFPADFEPPE